MRVLVVGPDWFGRISQFCVEAFRKLGLEVESFLWDGPARRHMELLKAAGEPPEALKASRRGPLLANALLLQDVKEVRPDLVFIVHNVSCPLTGGTLDRIRRRFELPVAAWVVDHPFRSYELVEPLGHVDRLFTWEPTLVPAFRRILPGRVSVLPHGAVATIYRPVELSEEEHSRFETPVSFVGSCWEGGGYFRARMLEALRGLPVKVYGAFWEKAIRARPDLGAMIVRRTLAPADVNRLYNASRIVLNLHHPQCAEGPNPRLFEAAAAGAFQLVDRNASHDAFFKPGEELVAYDDFVDLREKIVYWLQRPEEARAIAERARLRVVAEHTLDRRMASVLDALGLKRPVGAEAR